MNITPMMAEIYAVKEELSERFRTVRDLADGVRAFAKAHPAPPTPPSRKLIDGFPRGQSVADSDESLRELYATKEKLSLELSKAKRRKTAVAKTRRAKGSPAATFRSPKSSPNQPRGHAR